MRKIILVAVLFVASSARADTLSAEDLKVTWMELDALGSIGPDDELRERLLLQGCSEVSLCAQGGQRGLGAVSSPDVDESQKATILAADTHLDYLARRKKQPSLTILAWVEQRWSHFLDRVANQIPKEQRAKWDAGRKKAKI